MPEPQSPPSSPGGRGKRGGRENTRDSTSAPGKWEDVVPIHVLETVTTAPASMSGPGTMRRSQVAEKRDHNEADQRHARYKSVLYGAGRDVDQLRTVVIRNNRHSPR